MTSNSDYCKGRPSRSRAATLDDAPFMRLHTRASTRPMAPPAPSSVATGAKGGGHSINSSGAPRSTSAAPVGEESVDRTTPAASRGGRGRAIEDRRFGVYDSRRYRVEGGPAPPNPTDDEAEDPPAIRAIAIDDGSSPAKRPRRRGHHVPWTVQETEALVEGVERCGVGKWEVIKRLGLGFADQRTAVDLKDKWRNLVKVSSRSAYSSGAHIRHRPEGVSTGKRLHGVRGVSEELLRRIRSVTKERELQMNGDPRAVKLAGSTDIDVKPTTPDGK